MYKVFVIKKKDIDKWNIKNIELYHYFMKDWMNDGTWTIDSRMKDLLERQKDIKLGKIKKRKYKNNEYIYYLVYKDRIIFHSEIYINKKYILENYDKIKKNNKYEWVKKNYIFQKKNNNIARIEYVSINPKFIGKGLCKKGIEYAIKYIKNNFNVTGILITVGSSNIPAIKCYKKYFKIIDFIYTKSSVAGNSIQFILYRNFRNYHK